MTAFYRAASPKSRSHLSIENDVNLQNTSTSEELSKKAQKRLTLALNWLVLLSPWQTVEHPVTGKKFTMKINFVTLTLPSKQQHSDQYIKRNLLNSWLTTMRSKYNMKAYVWKAEAQENENLHFHITTNRFMNLFVVRRTWNRILAKHGYIQAYRENQQKFHATGFTVKNDLIPTWSMEQQKKAYDYGLKTNWSDPNSTDVHKVNKINNLAAYLVKYFVKPDEFRIVEGRKWFISRSLSRIEPLKLDFTTEIETELYCNCWDMPKYVKEDYYFKLWLKRPTDITQSGSHLIKDLFNKHLEELKPTVF